MGWMDAGSRLRWLHSVFLPARLSLARSGALYSRALGVSMLHPLYSARSTISGWNRHGRIPSPVELICRLGSARASRTRILIYCNRPLTRRGVGFFGAG